MKVDPRVFADLQAQADELAERRRRAAEGAEKAVGTKGKKKRKEEAINANLKAVEDLREKVDKSTVPLHEDMEDAGDSVMTPAQLDAAMEGDAPAEDESDAPLTEDAEEQPVEEVEAEAEATEELTEEAEASEEEPQDDQRPLRAAE